MGVGGGCKWKEGGLQTAVNRRDENVLECLLVLSFLVMTLHNILREVVWWYILRGVFCNVLEGTVLCRHIHVFVQNICSWKCDTAYKRFWVLLQWLTRGRDHNWHYAQTAKFSVALAFNSCKVFWHSQSHVLALHGAHTAGRWSDISRPVLYLRRFIYIASFLVTECIKMPYLFIFLRSKQLQCYCMWLL